MTLRLASGSYIRLQVDTGAQCNVVPLELYKKATNDDDLTQVTPSRTSITAYGGTTLSVVGTVLLRLWHGEFHCRLDCKLVDGQDIRPLLGRKACLGMNIISYFDNDQLNKPQSGGTPEYAIEEPSSLSVTQLTKKYPSVFEEGVGRLQGLYHIHLDDTVLPVQHPPRRVPVALRELLQRTLTDLTKQGIISPVQEPTPWISSMVVVPKKDGSLGIFLDPKDLNRAIQRESPNDRGCRHSTAWGQVIHCPRCQQGILARRAR